MTFWLILIGFMVTAWAWASKAWCSGMSSGVAEYAPRYDEIFSTLRKLRLYEKVFRFIAFVGLLVFAAGFILEFYG